jgi:ribosomal protein L37AE/L43A
MPSTFDGIPEDERELYPCPLCRTGNVAKDEGNGHWECDSCDFRRETERE